MIGRHVVTQEAAVRAATAGRLGVRQWRAELGQSLELGVGGDHGAEPLGEIVGAVGVS